MEGQEGLVALLEEKAHARAIRIGIRGIFMLCLAKENHPRAVAAGAAAAFARRVAEGGGGSRSALAAVERLCRMEGGHDAVVTDAGGGAAAVCALLVNHAYGVSERRRQTIAMAGGGGWGYATASAGWNVVRITRTQMRFCRCRLHTREILQRHNADVAGRGGMDSWPADVLGVRRRMEKLVGWVYAICRSRRRRWRHIAGEPCKNHLLDVRAGAKSYSHQCFSIQIHRKQ
uniref:Uncharacterized protein n=1 Tax=Oryza nivara TaxID=4536 RepID=A0A0E0J241_ORYNI